MKDGFIKCAAATTDIRVADTDYNTENIIKAVNDAAKTGIKLIVFPELCITGYTCGDLFLQKTLLDGAKESLIKIAGDTKNLDIITIVGLPYAVNQKLYNCAAVINGGHIKGLVPKLNIPNYSEFYETRHFTAGAGRAEYVNINGEEVPFGANILFKTDACADFVLAVEICEDLWTALPPSTNHTAAGATVIANLSASNEVIAKDEYRELLVRSQSARLYCGYIYSSAGYGESTTDLVFSGDNIVAENGTILARSRRFRNECVYSELDLERLVSERKKSNTYMVSTNDDYIIVNLDITPTETKLTRYVEKQPFVPSDNKKREKRSEDILSIQSMGLKKRLDHTKASTAVVGVSGGLDSTLALLVTVRAFDSLSLDRKNIIAVTMPCFGTTDRTYNNAVNFANSLGVTLKEINIKDAVNQHFKDIEQNPNEYDVTYENSQARERTQILMDIANKSSGLVIGTGDMSELALGWATYNGDHMSMYGVNAGVPKTLIRYLVDYEANRTNNETLKKTLRDILDTPVSPELLPPENGKISQKTEHIVGPYELHDFFLYHLMRFGSTPGKILRLAETAFDGEYDREVILAWLKVFYRRFFVQQFKRSCLPDGPKVGSVALSPRGDWRMPSDASYKIWAKELERL
ncbi:MAG: NAD(+) synthase [Oscillospiraceae bacterium]|nr:NAD(+) synthase [Oscillospiraceae bacterium]